MRSELYTGAIPVAGSPRVYSGRKSAPAPRTEQVQRLYTIPDFMRTAVATTGWKLSFPTGPAALL